MRGPAFRTRTTYSVRSGDPTGRCGPSAGVRLCPVPRVHVERHAGARTRIATAPLEFMTLWEQHVAEWQEDRSQDVEIAHRLTHHCWIAKVRQVAGDLQVLTTVRGTIQNLDALVLASINDHGGHALGVSLSADVCGRTHSCVRMGPAA